MNSGAKSAKKPEPTYTIDQTVPASLDAERAVLGAILLDNSSYLTAIDLEPDDFFLCAHRTIYLRMTDLLADNKPVDFVTLTEQLGQHKVDRKSELESVGGVAYVTSLTDGLPRVKNIKQYSDIIRDKAKLRRLIETADRIIKQAYEQDAPADEIVASAERQIGKVAGHLEMEHTDSVFASVCEFTRSTPVEIDWLVEGIIERGANGLIVAKPKIGKSICCSDLAVALAAGQSWMPGIGAGFYIPKPIKVGFCSREDTPGLLRWRLKHIATARQLHLEELEENLWINSKAETPRLMIDEPSDVRQLIAGIEKRKIEFLILDVFRRLHSADENEPNEMQKIIDVVCDIQTKTGCQIALVHHKRKDSGERGMISSLTDSARGSSVIAGYAEFIIGIQVVNPQAMKHDWVREFEVELKATMAPDNWYAAFKQKDDAGISVERVFWEPPKKGKKKADELAKPEAPKLPYADDSNEEPPF